MACLVPAGARATGGHNLFLLAGTATNEGPEAYPVTLYSAGSAHELEPLREVAGRGEGLYAVWTDPESRLLYVAYPPASPTTVSIVHEDNPSVADTVEFNPKRLIVIDGSSGLACLTGGQSYALYLLVAPGSPRGSGRLASVAGRSTREEARVAWGKWSLYKFFRFDGCPGGPAYCLSPRLLLEAGRLFLGDEMNRVGVGPAPPPLSGGRGPETIQVVASSARFLLVRPWYDARALASGVGRGGSVYVEDRASGSWKRVDVAGSTSRSRLFGLWLATVVEDWNPRNEVRGDVLYPAGDANPGRENERAQATPLLPSVLMRYATYQGRENIIPGTLALHNLVDGRNITIHTGQEDSEVLGVRKDGLVLYRVNDEIFSAQIEGDKLGPATLVVKGEDVPEVHWAFWSNAQPKPAAAPRPTAKKPVTGG